MENSTNNKENEIEYKHLAKRLVNALSNLSKESTNIGICALLKELELKPEIGIRRTFSPNAMIKAYTLLKLTHIKSYNALVNYLRNRPDEAILLGFDKNDTKVKLPTRQELWYFVKTLKTEDLETADYIVNTINGLAEKFNIMLDTEPATKKLKENASEKTASAHKSAKSEELVSFVKSRLKKKLKFKLRHNAVFRNEELLDTLIWIAYEQNFAESGTAIFSELLKRRSPNADTLFYHIKKFGMSELRDVFMEIFELVFRTARQMRLIGTRKVDLAIDATPWFFYGDHENYGVIGTKPERGTSWAYKFISVDVVNHNQRFTLFALPVMPEDNQTELVEKLLTYAKMKVKIGKVFLDRGFFDSKCINLLKKMGLQFIMPAKQNANVVKKVSKLSAPRIYPNCPMKNSRFNLVVLEKDGDKRYFATNIPLRSEDLILAFRIGEMYRSRWQIETGYRVKKYTFRGKTTSVNYVVRYLYFMLSVVLYNCWLLVDLGLTLFLGLSSKKSQITAKKFAVALINVGKDPNG